MRKGKEMMAKNSSDVVTMPKAADGLSCFHCPIPGCLYHEGSERYFASKRRLNQHLAKMHAEKKYLCSKCQKGFGLDWWRKYHEKSCGKQWKCSCGTCYSSRESLLTHARRNDHNLPSDIYCPKKKNGKNTKAQSAVQPLIIIIPMIADKMQKIPYVCQTVQESLPVKPRPILPKGFLPVLLSIPTASGLQETSSVDLEKNSAIASNKDNGTDCDEVIPISTLCNGSDISGAFELLQNSSTTLKEKQSSLKKTAVETQTNTKYTSRLTEINDSRRKKESRGSQCSGSVRKQNVHIESTETQTLESALIKMKRKTSLHRSRKKSVASTTTPEVNHTTPTLEQTAWSRLENFLFSNTDDLADSWKRLNKYSISTQTSHTDCSNKILCDTQTITDDIFQFNWQLSSETKCDMNKSSSEVSTDFTGNCSEDLNESNSVSDMPILEMFSSTDTSLCSLTTNDIPVDQVTNQNLDSSSQGSNSVLSPMFSSLLVPEKSRVHENEAPILSHTQTQTTTAPNFDYCSLLSNMETQTTDDFFLTGLEFLDMETQTPWEDISNLEDTLPVDQLSIEIQTDFPFSNVSVDDDPYDFMMGINMQSMLQNCPNKLSDVVNMETQTQHSTESPELTNSSAQTLDDLPTYLFP